MIKHQVFKIFSVSEGNSAVRSAPVGSLGKQIFEKSFNFFNESLLMISPRPPSTNIVSAYIQYIDKVTFQKSIFKAPTTALAKSSFWLPWKGNLESINGTSKML